MNPRRTYLAYALAPLFPSVYLVLTAFLSGSPYDTRSLSMVLVFSLPVSYVACLLCGVPTLALLKRVRRLDVVTLSAVGSVLGAVVFYVVDVGLAKLLEAPTEVTSALSRLGFGALFGVLVALPFALIAGYPLRSSRKGVHEPD